MSKININIKSTNMDLTDSIKKYVVEKVNMLEKIINPKDDTGVIADVEVGVITKGQHSGDIFRAEINLEVAGRFYRAESEMDDLYAAVDDVKDEMMRILRSDKNKKRDLLRRGAGKVKNMIRGFYWRRK